MTGKASEQIRYFNNEDGPAIGTVTGAVIEEDGCYFRDIDHSGVLKPFDDWRLDPQKRAEALAEVLTEEQKIGLLFISDWRMGTNQNDPEKLDESGLLDEGEFDGKTIFGHQHLPGTTTLLKEWWARHMILRANAQVRPLTEWINQLQAVAETCDVFVPVQVVSNSRNENGEAVFGMNDSIGVFTTWPGTLGIAAAYLGGEKETAKEFAECVRAEWNAVGLRKGYMYMADIATDPRWQRIYGTFGENPKLASDILANLIPGIQGSKQGVTEKGVAFTAKHFPGGSARENGFDPHYAMGQWNVYSTEGSLAKYHLPTFQTSIP